MEARENGSLDAWKLGSLEAWKHGNMETRKVGSIELWKHGNIETLKHGSRESQGGQSNRSKQVVQLSINCLWNLVLAKKLKILTSNMANISEFLNSCYFHIHVICQGSSWMRIQKS